MLATSALCSASNRINRVAPYEAKVTEKVNFQQFAHNELLVPCSAGSHRYFFAGSSPTRLWAGVHSDIPNMHPSCLLWDVCSIWLQGISSAMQSRCALSFCST